MTRFNSLLRHTLSNRSKFTALTLALLVSLFSSFSFANPAAGSNRPASTEGARSLNSTKANNDTNSIITGKVTKVNASDNAAAAANVTDNLTTPVRSSFKHAFKNAQLINSEVKGKFTKLTFKMNDMVLFAYYADNGKLLAVVRNILSSQLPTNLLLDLKRSYSDYWIAELFELNGEGQNAYYVTLENADTKLVLRSTSDNTWEIYQETEKN